MAKENDEKKEKIELLEKVKGLTPTADPRLFLDKDGRLYAAWYVEVMNDWFFKCLSDNVSRSGLL